MNATLVGDGVENPGNARVMVHAARMFGAACRFRDTKGLAQSPDEIANFATISGSELQTLHSRIIAFDNIPGAGEVYGFRAGRDFALLVGNERRGLSHEFVKAATDRVCVPMVSHQINCLNVAAAAAVGLYYLCGTPVAPMSIRQNPGSRRPEVLLLGAGDHVEVGSAIRSAAALGWNRLFLEDRYQTWFGCDRVIRSESRAAARRGRNDILCIPAPEKASHAFARVTVITRQPARYSTAPCQPGARHKPVNRHSGRESRGSDGRRVVTVRKANRVRTPTASCGRLHLPLPPDYDNRSGRSLAAGRKASVG